MIKKRLFNSGLIITGAVMTLPAHALTSLPVPTEPIYYEPPVVEMTTEVSTYNCYEIDYAIRQLHPYRYSYKPGFYEDGSNQLAASLLIFDSLAVVGLAYLGYSALVEEKESRRIEVVEQNIAMLQRAKAEQHCFE